VPWGEDCGPPFQVGGALPATGCRHCGSRPGGSGGSCCCWDYSAVLDELGLQWSARALLTYLLTALAAPSGAMSQGKGSLPSCGAQLLC
jgi:hypothetical protein